MNEKSLSLRDIWHIFWTRKFWFFLPLVIASSVAFGGSYLLPVVYESSTKIIISNINLVSRDLKQMMPTEVTDLPGGRRGYRGWLASTRSEITSTSYLNTLIIELKINPTKEITDRAIRMQDQFPEWNIDIIERKLLIDDLKDKISVSLIGDNQIVITCRSDNPKQANSLATKLAEIYREKKLADEVRSVRESQIFTDQQLATSKREYEEAERELVNFKNSYIADRLKSGISSESNLGEIDSEVDATRLELTESIDRRNFLVAKLVAAGVDTNAAVDKIPGMQIFIDDALEANREVAGLMKKYVWRDAKIQGQLSKVSFALDDLFDASQAAAARFYPEWGADMQVEIGELVYRTHYIDFIKGKENILRVAVDKIKSTIANSPYYEQETERLQERVQNKRDTYEKWQKQASGIRILQATTAAEAENKYRVLEPASIPLRPASPNRPKILIMGISLGLLLGVCAVVIVEVLDHSITSIDDAEEYFGYEVVGTIPKIGAGTK